MSTMNTNKISQIFNSLISEGIEPRHVVPFCLRLHGKCLKDVSRSLGVSRGYLYKALAGERKANKSLIQELDRLGINPWQDA